MTADGQEERFESSEPRTTQPPIPVSSSVVRRGTGPRTRQGKERSRRNSLRHGIFSEAVVLETESRAEYDSLRKSLTDDRQPVGALEEILVDELAALLWRYRRLLVAEAAEIRAASEFVKWDERQRQSVEAGSISQVRYNGGLVRKIANDEALQTCLSLLDELRYNFARNGFHLEDDSLILAKVYGDAEPRDWANNLFKSYRGWYDIATAADHLREQMGLPSLEECRKSFLEELDEEMKRLDNYEKEQASIESIRMKIEALRHNVPDTPRLDRLLKYEAGLERAIDRVLNQLERAQRMRLGQPVAPRIDVNVSSS
jgi:hypothetical protein